MDRGEGVLRRLRGLEDKRRPFEPLWDDVGKYVLPLRRDAGNSPGRKRQEYIFDAAPTRKNVIQH